MSRSVIPSVTIIAAIPLPMLLRLTSAWLSHRNSVLLYHRQQQVIRKLALAVPFLEFWLILVIWFSQDFQDKHCFLWLVLRHDCGREGGRREEWGNRDYLQLWVSMVLLFLVFLCFLTCFMITTPEIKQERDKKHRMNAKKHAWRHSLHDLAVSEMNLARENIL